MTRLVAFGCSNTYGEALPDCWYEVRAGEWGARDTPSTQAWPALLADQLGLLCVNRAVPGGSNKLMLHRILNTEFLEGDVVIAAWTYPTRWCTINTDDSTCIAKLDHNWIFNPLYSTKYGPWLIDAKWRIDPYHRKQNQMFYKYITNSRDGQHEVYQSAYTAQLHCERLGIQIYHGWYRREGDYDVKAPVYDRHVNWLDRNFNEFTVDKGIDESHPGVQSHRALSNYIANVCKAPLL